MLLQAPRSQLVLVDYQARLMPAIFESDAVLANALRLAKTARLLGVPIWGTEQNPAKLGENVAALRECCERTFAKMHFSATAEGLGEHLAETPRDMIVVAGCEAHVCLLQTVLELIGKRHKVWVVTDACGSRSPHNRDAAFARLARAGATLVTTEMVGFEWLRTAEHPAFRDFQALIR